MKSWMVISALVLSLMGCAEAVRSTAVPSELMETVQVDGFSGPIRYWGDRNDPALLDDMLKAVAEHPVPADPQDPSGPGIGALALSGGGDCGAFGAGLLCGWTDRGDRPRFRVVTGVSTGALIAPLAFLGRSHDAALRDAYTTVSRKDVMTMRAIIDWLRYDSIADSTPLYEYAGKIVSDDVIREIAAEHAKGRRLYIQTVNLDAQRPVIWDMGAIASSGSPNTAKLFLQILVGSSAIPGVFQPQYVQVRTGDKVYDEMHVDGGTVSQMLLNTLPVDLAELRKRMIGIGNFMPDRKMRVYVVRNGWIRPEWQYIHPRLLPIAKRAISTMIKSQADADLDLMYMRAQAAGMDFNLCYIPDEFRRENRKEFDPVEMTRLFEHGYDLAKNGDPWAKAPPRYVTAQSRPTTQSIAP